jgi:hypothetical protein
VTDFIKGLERDLVEAAERRVAAGSPASAEPRPTRTGSARAPRPPLRTLVVAAALLLAVAGTAAAGTLLALRGSVIPGPTERDAGPQQTPAPGTSTITALRAADPGGGIPWALRVARSRTGLVCGTVGQARPGGPFGLVGLDGRFRTLASSAVDGCGQLPLIGARVFDARRARDVRTVVNGVAGARLRKVEVTVAGRQRSLKVGSGGTFVLALRGYPEDTGIEVRLTFAGGRTAEHSFGRSPFVVPDPAGDPAWKLISFVSDGDPRQCTSFTTARETQRRLASSPAACGLLGDPRRERGYYFAVRRIEPTGGRPYSEERGHWVGHPPRTAVWGEAGENVKRVEVIGPGGKRRLRFAPSRSFLALYPPNVNPRSLRVRVTLRDGSVHTHRGDTHLERHP